MAPPAGAPALGLAGAPGLNPQELLAVVPLVERLGLIEPLVTLQSDEPRADRVGDRLGERGLAGAGGALDEHGLGETIGKVDHRRDGLVTQVVVLREKFLYLFGRLEAHRRHAGETESLGELFLGV